VSTVELDDFEAIILTVTVDELAADPLLTDDQLHTKIISGLVEPVLVRLKLPDAIMNYLLKLIKSNGH
jgi:hypothetical protein